MNHWAVADAGSQRGNDPEWRTLLDALPVAAYLCDPTGLITYFNPQAVRLWGRAPKLCDPIDRFCGSYRLFAMDGTPIEHRECWMALALRDQQHYRERQIIVEKPDGSRRFVQANASPYFDSDGQLRGAINILIDETDAVTDRHAIQHLAAIVESSEDAIVGMSFDGIIQSWNTGAERMFGHSAQEAVGRHISLIIPEDRLAEEDEILDRLKAGERIEHFETVRVAQDGKELPVSLTVSPIRDKSGKLIGASKISRDISQLKRTEQELREASRLKDEFLATLAHELRNPLAPISSGLELMKTSSDDPARLEYLRGVIERQTHQLTVLVDDLVDLSRISRGKFRLHLSTISLRDLIEGAVEASQPLIQSQGHRLTIDVADWDILVRCDKPRLVQVLSNLLNNAAKYTPREGQIDLTVRAQGDDIFMSVRDTGIGIPHDLQDKVFEMFMQIGQADKPTSGLGIGLTLVDSLVRMHQGDIKVHSDGADQGTEFTVRLPIVATAPPRSKASSEGAAINGKRHRILVADDNTDAGDLLVLLLEKMGNQVRLARDGQEALAVAMEYRPDIMFLDLGMPKMNGHEVAQRIREQPWGEPVRIVALTGWSQPEHQAQAKRAGFNDYVVKPVTSSQLIDLLSEPGTSDPSAAG